MRHHIAQFLFSCCVIIILSASSFVNAKMRLVISQSVFHRAALQRRYFHRGYLLLLRTEPQLFQQGVPRYHGRKPTWGSCCTTAWHGRHSCWLKAACPSAPSAPWSAISISFTFPVRSKMYMASAHGTIVQSILHYKNWSHSPLYIFRFSDI